MLGAPGPNDYSGLIASSTIDGSRGDGTKFQWLSEKDANDLCKQHEKLAYNIASRYAGKGIGIGDLKAASLLGLVEASRNFDPKLGIPFWGFALHRTEGAVKDLFRPGRYAPDFQRKESLNTSISDEDEEQKINLVIDESEPALSLDLSELTPRERTVIEARADDRTLQSVGREVGLSLERVRQIEAKAWTKLRKQEAITSCCPPAPTGAPSISTALRPFPPFLAREVPGYFDFLERMAALSKACVFDCLGPTDV